MGLDRKGPAPKMTKNKTSNIVREWCIVSLWVCLKDTCICPRKSCVRLRDTCICPRETCMCPRDTCICPRETCICPREDMYMSQDTHAHIAETHERVLIEARHWYGLVLGIWHWPNQDGRKTGVLPKPKYLSRGFNRATERRCECAMSTLSVQRMTTK